MDPYLEISPLYHELHTQFLAEAQRLLQPQLKPRYIAKLERHLSEGSVWEVEAGLISLEGKEPDLTVRAADPSSPVAESTAVLATPTASTTENLDEDELQLRRQRRIVIYVQTRPRRAVTSIELLSPSNKAGGSTGQAGYLEKRASALRGGLHWVEVDLLRGGQRPPIPLSLPQPADYLAYVAQATPTGWSHLVYAWGLRDSLPRLAIPLLGADHALLDLGACFRSAYDAVFDEEEVNYAGPPPPPPLSPEDLTWAADLLCQHGLRP
jgi:hypothetical protein